MSHSNQQLVPPLVLIVDHTPFDVSKLEVHYRIARVTSGEAALAFLVTQLPDIILLDISLPEIRGLELCQKLKSDVRYEAIPIVCLASVDSESLEAQCFEVGAVDYLVKPTLPTLLSKLMVRVKSHLATARALATLKASNLQWQREKQLVERNIIKMREDLDFDYRYLSVFMRSYHRTGGDIVLSTSVGEKQYILLGDFTGHGLAASVCVPFVMGLFYREAVIYDHLAGLLKLINHELVEHLPTAMFMAVSAVELNTHTGEALLYNCGMPEVLLFDSSGLVNEYESACLPLGIKSQLDLLVPVRLQLTEQNRLVLHTDGVTEARSAEGELFGLKRLTLMLAGLNQQLHGLECIEPALKAFAADGPPLDDMSLVELSWRPVV